jgi:hypothetical protein
VELLFGADQQVAEASAGYFPSGFGKCDRESSESIGESKIMEPASIQIDKRFGEEFEGIYEFRQVTQGEYERALISYMDALGKIAKQDILRVNREMLWTAIVKQPENKPLSKDCVVQGQLPYGLSIKLQGVYDKVNGIEAEEQRFLSEPSGTANQTLDSPSSSSASDSDGLKQSTKQPAEEPSLNSQQS